MMKKLILAGSMLCFALAASAQSPATPTPAARTPAHNAVNDAYKRAVKEAQENDTPLPEKPTKPSKPKRGTGKPGA